MTGVVLKRLVFPSLKLNFGLSWKIQQLDHCLLTNMILPSPLWLTERHCVTFNFISLQDETLVAYHRFPVSRNLLEQCHHCQNTSIRGFSIRAPKKEPKGKKGGKPKVLLTDEEINTVTDIDAFRSLLALAVTKLKENYIKNLSLRTSVGRIESLPVEFDGGTYPLNEIAQVTRKNPSLLVVNLASLPQAIKAVLDAIQKSGMNLNPQQEGTTIYVPIPQITREHRETLAKNAKVLFNQTKDELHDVQNRTIKTVKQKKADFSEDLIFNVQQQIMALTNSSVSEAEEIFHKKVAELLGGK